MSDFLDQCASCQKYIELDEELRERRNQYGYPVPVCELCDRIKYDDLYKNVIRLGSYWLC